MIKVFRAIISDATGLAGGGITLGGVVISFQEIESILRVIALMVSIAVGIATFIYYFKKIRRIQ